MKNIYLGFPSTARWVPSIPQMTLLRPYLRKIRAALLAILCSSGMVTTWSGWGWGRRKQICTASHEQLQCMHLHRHLLSAGSGIHLKYRGRSKPPAQVWRGALGLFRFHVLDGGIECHPKTAHLLLRTCTEPLILKKGRERGPFSPYSS